MYKVLEQTKEEKMAMYMKLPKKQIAEMLINCYDNLTLLMQEKNRVNPVVMDDSTCDSCGCHPNVIYTTSKGRFCERCKPTR